MEMATATVKGTIRLRMDVGRMTTANSLSVFRSVHPLTNTPCSHYVWQGYRYLHFPELNEVALSLSSLEPPGRHV